MSSAVYAKLEVYLADEIIPGKAKATFKKQTGVLRLELPVKKRKCSSAAPLESLKEAAQTRSQQARAEKAGCAGCRSGAGGAHARTREASTPGEEGCPCPYARAAIVDGAGDGARTRRRSRG